MSMNIDWTTALIGAGVGYFAKSKVEETKDEVKKAVSETAAAAAIAAAQAVNGQPTGQGQNGQKTH